MTVTPIKKNESAPSRSDERQALTAAISQLSATTLVVERYRAGRDRNEDQRFAILNDQASAEEALNLAQAELAQTYLNNALGTDGDKNSAPDIEQVRARLTTIGDALKANSEVHSALRVGLDESEQALEAARRRLPGAVAAVLRADPAVASLWSEFEKAKRRIAELQLALQEIAGRDGVVMERRHWLPLSDVPISEINGLAARWTTALKRLAEDPDAGLPSGF